MDVHSCRSFRYTHASTNTAGIYNSDELSTLNIEDSISSKDARKERMCTTRTVIHAAQSGFPNNRHRIYSRLQQPNLLLGRSESGTWFVNHWCFELMVRSENLSNTFG
jgi:hypothetical protein